MKDDNVFIQFAELCVEAAPLVEWRLQRGPGKYSLAQTMTLALSIALRARAGDAEARELLASVDTFHALRERVAAVVH